MGDKLMLEPHVQVYLQRYLDMLPADAPQRTAPAEASPFGDSPELADELGQLIVAGVKTATCSALWAYEAEGSAIPVVGLLTVVLAGNKEPLCIIETTEVEVRPFNQVDAQFAYEEGEDDRTLEAWRKAHWRYFTRTLAADYNLQPAEEMPLVCERFRVVYPRR
jgi:uncharacterized protein YhfF